MSRETPLIGDPPKVADKIKISRDEVLSFLSKVNRPVNKNTKRWARGELRRRKERQSLPRGRDLSFSQSDAARQIIYGRMRFGGIISFLHVTENKSRLNIVVTVAGHEIQEIEELYLDGNLIEFGLGNAASPSDPRWSLSGTRPDGTTISEYNGKVFMAADRTGADSQTVQSDFNTLMPTYWTSDHRQRGCAHVAIICVWNAVAFAEDFPEIEFVGKGKKVYDPRTATTVYSNNAALCIADVLMSSRYGLGCSLSELDTSTNVGGLQWAADICDENVTLAAGGTEDRYTVNAVFDMDMTPDEIIEDMLSAMGGHIHWSGGKWRFFPAKYITPSLTLTDDDLRGPVNVETVLSRADNFNCIRGEFVSADNKFETTDFPPIKLTSAITLDNNVESWEDITLPCTTSPATAQRLAMIALRRQREALRVSAPFSLKAFGLIPGDTVMLTLARYGWTSKVFEVQEVEFYAEERNLDLVVELQLRETSTSVYSWDETQDEQNFKPSPNTALPDPFVALPPTGLTLESGTDQLIIQGDGSIVTRLKISWTLPADAMVTEGGKIEIQLKTTAATKWQTVALVDGNSEEFYYVGPKDGVPIDARIRSMNALRAYSSWVTQTNYTILGKTEPPDDVTNFQATLEEFGIRLTWDEIDDVDVLDYEIRVGASWGSSSLIGRVAGDSYLWKVNTAGTYNLMIKARDTTRNYSTNAAVESVVIAAPSAPGLSYTIEGGDLVLAWTAPSSDFPVKEYRVSYGATYGSSTAVLTVSALKTKIRVDWSGSRTWWVVAIDNAGNAGTPDDVSVSITVPSVVQGLIAKTVDNNILLDWTDPSSHTLPIDYYKVYKGATFGAAVLLGTVGGTFATYIETIGAEYKYWVTAVDTAGNEGAESSVTRIVLNPPDYIIEADQIIDPEDPDSTLTDAYPLGDGVSFYAPIDATETWEDHFINNSASTFQDLIDDGYSLYLEPGTGGTGSMVFEYDLGQVLPQQIVTVSYSKTDMTGITTVTVKIAYKEDIGDPWTEETASQVFAQNFRYVRITLEIVASGPGDIALIENVNLKIDVKKQTDSGTYTITSSGGTVVNFNLSFLEVQSVSVNAQGSTSIYAVRDFAGGTNPTGFTVRHFNNAGTEQSSGTGTWTAEGIVNVV
jgi:hypothetical protein